MQCDGLSPLLNGAVEDLAHALEHVSLGSERDNKYAIIQAATSVELVLKEKLPSMGVSIFSKKPPYHSLDFYNCIEALYARDIPLPFQSDGDASSREKYCVHLGSGPDPARG